MIPNQRTYERKVTFPTAPNDARPRSLSRPTASRSQVEESRLSIEPACPRPDRPFAPGGGLRFALASTTAAAIAVGRPRPGFERLHDRARPGRAHAAMDIDRNEFDARRNAEGRVGRVLERHFHEIAEDRRGVERGLRAAAERTRLVVAHEHAEREVRRIADEPEVLCVVGGAGLAGKVLADFLDRDAGAALDNALQNGGDLIGGERIDHAF